MRKMIHTLCKSTRLLLLLALLSGTAVSAQDHKSKMNLSREFPVTRETTLEIQNKYGKIQVVSWEKDLVQIDVEIRVSESNASKLKKLKDDISIDFTGTKTYIIAKSQFKSESKRLVSELKSVSHTLSGSNKNVEINYMISMPSYMDLVLNNKFGDIYMDDHSGEVEISLSNGAMKANRLDGNANITLNFANGMIKTLGSATLRLSYSDLTLGDAGQLDMTSKSSKLNADSINVLKINSRRDKLFFQRVEYLYGNSNFSEVWIYNFLRESDLSMKYGKLTIEHVRPAFSKIYVKSEYTDVTFMFNEQCSFNVDILYHEKSLVRLPDNLSSLSESAEGKEHYRTLGTLGGDEPSAQVTIDGLQKCFINLSIK
ncbi:MAG: hypothetical protein GY790_01665 [Bacteroidetes bacterium]|nr:hypothetical protein [Bacteroidota bacterium]